MLQITVREEFLAEKGQGIQWMKALVRNSRGLKSQGHSKNRRTLNVEIRFFCTCPLPQTQLLFITFSRLLGWTPFTRLLSRQDSGELRSWDKASMTIWRSHLSSSVAYRRAQPSRDTASNLEHRKQVTRWTWQLSQVVLTFFRCPVLGTLSRDDIGFNHSVKASIPESPQICKRGSLILWKFIDKESVAGRLHFL